MPKKAKVLNEINISFCAKSINEWFSRSAVAAFLLPLDPTVAELSDVKTAVSEAVTNAIVHGYRSGAGTVYINAKILSDNSFVIRIRDKGVGIENIEQAMTPMFTTAGDERAGLGFAVMQSFMDKLSVRSAPGRGTTVTMSKNFSKPLSYEATGYNH